MRWRDIGIVLKSVPYAERTSIVSIFTKDHGHHRGLASFSKGYAHQVGEKVSVQWSSRLENQLGYYHLDVQESPFTSFLHDILRLHVLQGVCSLMEITPIRAVYSPLHDALSMFLQSMMCGGKSWPQNLVILEFIFLREMGYGLDTTRCTVTGQKHNLLYISPKTGKAVSAKGAGRWANKLLSLPSFIVTSEEHHHKPQKQEHNKDIITGLHLTGYFLNKHFQQQGHPLSDTFWQAHHLLAQKLT